jgi:Protein of unknown function (DUF3800)
MHMLFVDESGTPPKANRADEQPYFVLGGCMIPEAYWHQVKADLHQLKRKHRVTGEIKWRYFAPPKENATSHALSHLNAVEKEELRSGLYQIIARYKSIRVLAVITNAPKAYTLDYINNDDDLYWYSYKQLTERFQYYLQDISKTSGQKINGIIVCDHRGPRDDKRLQGLHDKLMSGNHDAHSNYHNLIEGLFISPSHFSVGIQLADLVAGAVLRMIKNGDKRFYDQIVGSFRTSPTGHIEGYGLVKYPKE